MVYGACEHLTFKPELASQKEFKAAAAVIVVIVVLVVLFLLLLLMPWACGRGEIVVFVTSSFHT